MKIGIVNDLAICVDSLQKVLTSVPEHQVVWVAQNGLEAVERCREITPDLILMDLLMPVMNGVEATRMIMQTNPCPILVVTSTVTGNSAKVFEAMGAGALDAVATPVIGKTGEAAKGEDLLKKIFRIGQLTGNMLKKSGKGTRVVARPKVEIEGIDLVLLGCSTGGPKILTEILSNFPGNFPAAFIIIQHMDEQFAPGLVKWIDSQIDMPVRIAKDGAMPEPGTVLMACTDDHLVMTPKLTLSYSSEPQNNFYHPSVDVFFLSVAQYWPAAGTAALLTGIGRDGAEGLLALHNRNWYTVAQDRDSSIVYGMPKAAAQLGAATEILPASEIGNAIKNFLLDKQKTYDEQ
ncbi:MAG: chemotaxis protein [Nitrospira bacterium SG8_35_1]|nr:MAG: chemotaxis protein [Nitrospira bacterium SG8_35_1]